MRNRVYRRYWLGLIMLLAVSSFADRAVYCRLEWLEAHPGSVQENPRLRLLAMLTRDFSDMIPAEKGGEVFDGLMSSQRSGPGTKGTLDFLEARLLDPTYTPSNKAVAEAEKELRKLYAEEKPGSMRQKAFRNRMLFFLVKESDRFVRGTSDQRRRAVMELNEDIQSDSQVVKAQNMADANSVDFDARIAEEVESRKRMGLPPLARGGDRAIYAAGQVMNLEPRDGNAVGLLRRIGD